MNLTTASSDLTTFPAPGPLRAAGEPIPPRITGAPWVNLVGIDGCGVPDCERYTPTCPPDPTDPADWPAWTDHWFWEPTEMLEDLPMPGLEAEPYEPSAEDLADYHRWSLELEARRLGMAAYEPTAEDWADYRQWAAELEARTAAARMADPIYGYE